MTDLVYITQPDVYTSTANITHIIPQNSGIGIVFDQTIFYIQGGGQPSDSGSIVHSSGEHNIAKVFRDSEGRVIHLIIGAADFFSVGDSVEMCVNEEQRFIHSRLHSAGHLIDIAVLEHFDCFESGKGYHYPEGAYVEYSILGNNVPEIESITQSVTQTLNELIAEDIPVEIRFDTTQQKHGCDLRIMNFRGHDAMPCGGTHVKSSGELSGLTIRYIKIKKGKMKVAYTI